MPFRTNLSLYDSRNHLVALVETKRRAGTSIEWAAGLRHNMLVDGEPPPVRFFMVATTDYIYLWKDPSRKPDDAYPDYYAETPRLFRPYLEDIRSTLQTMTPESFELLVSLWLSQLMYKSIDTIHITDDSGWLLESGFIDAVREGRVEYDEAA